MKDCCLSCKIRKVRYQCGLDLEVGALLQMSPKSGLSMIPGHTMLLASLQESIFRVLESTLLWGPSLLRPDMLILLRKTYTLYVFGAARDSSLQCKLPNADGQPVSEFVSMKVSQSVSEWVIE